MTDEDFALLKARVSERYARSQQAPRVVEALDLHNDRVLEHVDQIAAGEELEAGEHELLRTIAVLHDVAKSDSDLLNHAEVGAKEAKEILTELGKSAGFIDAVVKGIERHMGPFPFIDEEAEKHHQRTGEHIHLPRPESRVEQLFYDADMLALIDVAGIEKIVVLRAESPEFAKEDEETASTDGISPREAAYRSALQSMERAVATLHSATARRIAEDLVATATEHVESQLA